MVSILTDIFFPVRCAGCGIPVSSNQKHLCPVCSGRIVPEENSSPIDTGSRTDNKSGAWTDRHWYLSKSITITDYKGIIKSIICAMKFRKLPGHHVILGNLALLTFQKHSFPVDIITWIPMNSKKKWRRGFNQSELISQYISKRSGIPCLPLLTEKSGAQSQKKLGLRDRFIHSLNRYNTTSARGLSGRKVLIVDDVYTTGATINECARQLRLAGAEDVFSLTIARTDLKRLEKF